jgi:long-chain acyl-CoA synthetase
MYKENGKWITITYDDLVFKVENIAMGLMKLGIKPEDRVAVKAHSSARWIWADLGSLFAGACTVSVYPSLSRTETTMIVNHSECKAIFVDTHERVHEVMGYLDDLPTVKYVICLEKGFKGNGTNVLGLGEVAYSGFTSRDGLLPELKTRHEGIKADTPAIMVYTSGTMGSLKGVMHTHKGILYPGIRGYKHLQIYGHTENYNTVVMCYLPLSHILEKINSYYGPLMLGALIGFGESPATLLTDIGVIRPTWVMFVPRLVARVFLLRKGFLIHRARQTALGLGDRCRYQGNLRLGGQPRPDRYHPSLCRAADRRTP